jgi:hypothetical protein
VANLTFIHIGINPLENPPGKCLAQLVRDGPLQPFGAIFGSHEYG